MAISIPRILKVCGVLNWQLYGYAIEGEIEQEKCWFSAGTLRWCAFPVCPVLRSTLASALYCTLSFIVVASQAFVGGPFSILPHSGPAASGSPRLIPEQLRKFRNQLLKL
jgi:hypothetical protein